MNRLEHRDSEGVGGKFQGIHVEGLKKHFTEYSFLRKVNPFQGPEYVRAVDGVDFHIRDGETLGLVGESGCGKSTLARVILRLIEPTAGSIYFDGEDITQYSTEELRQFRSKAQMIFQDPASSLNPRYKVLSTLTEPMKVHGIGTSKQDRIARAEEIIERVGLQKDHLYRYPHAFSGGQKQRIALARSLVVDPDVLIADEPVSALDVSVQAQILNLLKNLKEERDLTMLFISHDISTIRYMSDKIAVMYLGKIVEINDSEQLFKNPRHPYTKALLANVPIPNPTADRTRVNLRGEVPSPINPPSGCRFHTRCPEVIPPDDIEIDDEKFRGLFRFKRDLMTDDIGSGIFDVTTICEEYLGEASSKSLTPALERLLTRALEALSDGDDERAMDILDERITSICEDQEPELIDQNSNCQVACHLYNENDQK